MCWKELVSQGWRALELLFCGVWHGVVWYGVAWCGVFGYMFKQKRGVGQSGEASMELLCGAALLTLSGALWRGVVPVVWPVRCATDITPLFCLCTCATLWRCLALGLRVIFGNNLFNCSFCGFF